MSAGNQLEHCVPAASRESMSATMRFVMTLTAAAGLCAHSAFAVTGVTNCYAYPNFGSTNGLVLVGDAVTAGNVLRLTPAVEGKTGDVWLATKQPCAAGFDTRFRFQITQLGNIFGNEPGGDGFTFVVQNVSATDLSWALGGTNNYVGVFFNTFWNWPGCTSCPDVSGNSVGILTNQTYVTQADLNPLSIDLSDGAVHEARIVFDGTALTVWVDSVQALANVAVPNLQPGVDANGEGWVGFTAGTGAAYENHDLLGWTFCTTGATNPPQPFPPVITSQPQDQTVYAGDTAEFGVTAAGTLPMRYQWYGAGTPIPGGTNATLVLSNVQTNQAGDYHVAVSNDFGGMTSATALLTVLDFPACVTFSDFSAPGGLELVGAATVVGGVLRVTPAADSQSGAAWLQEKQQCAAGFDTSFRFRISESGNIFGNEPGGDGFTFSVQNNSPLDPAFGISSTNYASVFFNTFWNWPGCTCPDVSDNSVGILLNQDYLQGYVAQTDLNPLGINLSDGQVHEGRISYDGTGLTVWVDGAMVLTNVPVGGLQSATDASGKGWVGFTAGNGAAFENHDLLNWTFCAAAPPNPPPTNCVVPPAGLVAWWPGNGNTLDVVGGNHGSLINGAGYAPGEIGAAFSFTALDQSVRIPDAPALNPTSGLTLEGWVWVSQYPDNDGVTIAGKDAPWSTRQYLIALNWAGNRWSFRPHVTVPGGMKFFDGTTAIQTRAWYHVAMTHDNATLRLYVNGVFDGSFAAPGMATPTTNPMNIGGFGVPPWTLFGRVDELSLYNRALMSNEISAIYLAGSLGKCPPLSPTNSPPVAKIVLSPLTPLFGLSNNVVVAAPCGSATVILDGSQSNDPNNDPLAYEWTEGTNHLGSSVMLTTEFEVGDHEVTLAVSDSQTIASATEAVEVVTAAQAVGIVILYVETSNLSRRNTRPLLASLKAAAEAFDRCNATLGAMQLKAFQNKVRVQIQPFDADVAEELIEAAQQIIDAVER